MHLPQRGLREGARCGATAGRAEIALMRIGKPLLVTTTILGLGLGIYETFRFAPGMGVLLLVVLALFGAGIAWIVSIASAERRGKD
jgi:hypothetical protein